MRAVQQTIKHWEHVVPYVHVPRNEKEYEKLMIFVDELMEWSRHHKDEHATSPFLKHTDRGQFSYNITISGKYRVKILYRFA